MKTQHTLASGFRDCRPPRNRRRGLSVLEFVGCLMALLGGIWIGAVYLGVDIRHVVYGALSESKLMDKVPEKWRPVETAAERAPSAQELAESVHRELVSLRHDIAALQTGEPANRGGVDSTQATGGKDGAAVDRQQVAKQATQEYWADLHEVIQNEIALQRDAESAATEGNATKVAALKGRISQLTANAIRALPIAGVDPAAVTLAKDLANWYERGARLFDQAVQIWESSAGASRDSQALKDWEQAQVQHRNEGRLLRAEVAAVRDSLTRRFGAEFAEFSGI